MNEIEKKLQASFDKESTNYDSDTSTFHHRISEYIVENLLSEDLRVYQPRNILDAGGGTGKLSVFLGKAGYQVSLIDISPGQVAVAKAKIKQENLRIECLVGNCEATGLPAQSFDFILCVGEVISYTPNPQRLLTEFNRLLQPKGIIWFDFFNSRGWAFEAGDPMEKVRWVESEQYSIQMPDWDYPARIMSNDYVRSLLRDTGFETPKDYGLISLSHTLPLGTRYSKRYEIETLNRYRAIELAMSKSPSCVGTAWSNIMVAQKN